MGEQVWLRVDEYAIMLPHEAFQPVGWPNQAGGQTVYAHLVRTKVKKLGARQGLIVKMSLDDPEEKARFYVTTRLADVAAYFPGHHTNQIPTFLFSRPPPAFTQID